MNESTRVATRLTVGERFDKLSIALHWTTVALVVAQFTTAWTLGPSDVALLTAHRSMGVLTWIVAAMRLAWRHSYAWLPPFPANMPKIQQRIAKINEYGLYVMLLLQPLTGMGATLFYGREFGLFAWRLGPFLAPNDALGHRVLRLHDFGATLLLALIGLHASTALYHRLILRDRVLQRMLP